MGLLLSESSNTWTRYPGWADFLVRFGFGWQDRAPASRRIAVISMPCDSPGAGLVALGAMRRRLAVENANDSAAHLERIERLATQRGQVPLRHVKQSGRFQIEKIDSDGMIWVRLTTSRGMQEKPMMAVLPRYANDWYFEGEAPVQALDGEALPYKAFYDEVVGGSHPVLPENLAHSDSWVCLAGHTMGERASRTGAEAIRFRVNGEEAPLSGLLTVHSWSPKRVSRVTFFNTRTEQLERKTAPPRLVVADGDTAFLKAVSSPDFKESDVVGVIHRVAARDQLEAVGAKLSGLTQWYESDVERADESTPVPRAIAVVVFRRR